MSRAYLPNRASRVGRSLQPSWLPSLRMAGFAPAFSARFPGVHSAWQHPHNSPPPCSTGMPPRGICCKTGDLVERCCPSQLLRFRESPRCVLWPPRCGVSTLHDRAVMSTYAAFAVLADRARGCLSSRHPVCAAPATRARRIALSSRREENSCWL